MAEFAMRAVPCAPWERELCRIAPWPNVTGEATDPTDNQLVREETNPALAFVGGREKREMQGAQEKKKT